MKLSRRDRFKIFGGGLLSLVFGLVVLVGLLLALMQIVR